MVVLRGPDTQMREWKRALGRTYLPSTMILAIASGATGLPSPLDKPATPGNVNAWVCRGVTCLAPVDRLDTLTDVLKSGNFR